MQRSQESGDRGAREELRLAEGVAAGVSSGGRLALGSSGHTGTERRTDSGHSAGGEGGLLAQGAAGLARREGGASIVPRQKDAASDGEEEEDREAQTRAPCLGTPPPPAALADNGRPGWEGRCWPCI